MEEKQLSLTWNNHGSTYKSMFNALRQKNILTDITLACDGSQFTAHQLVLATCSDYFQSMLSSVPSGGHPIVYLRGVPAREMHAMLEFMYTGQALLPRSQVNGLLDTAEALKIKGLGVKLSQEELESCRTVEEERLLDAKSGVMGFQSKELEEIIAETRSTSTQQRSKNSFKVLNLKVGNTVPANINFKDSHDEIIKENKNKDKDGSVEPLPQKRKIFQFEECKRPDVGFGHSNISSERIAQMHLGAQDGSSLKKQRLMEYKTNSGGQNESNISSNSSSHSQILCQSAVKKVPITQPGESISRKLYIEPMSNVSVKSEPNSPLSHREYEMYSVNVPLYHGNKHQSKQMNNRRNPEHCNSVPINSPHTQEYFPHVLPKNHSKTDSEALAVLFGLEEQSTPTQFRPLGVNNTCEGEWLAAGAGGASPLLGDIVDSVDCLAAVAEDSLADGSSEEGVGDTFPPGAGGLIEDGRLSRSAGSRVPGEEEVARDGTHNEVGMRREGTCSFEEEAQLYLEAFTRSAGLNRDSVKLPLHDEVQPQDSRTACSGSTTPPLPSYLLNQSGGNTLDPGVEDTENRRFTCPICKKSFNKAAILKRHHLAHFRPYSCEVCQRSFTRREVLAEHLQEHNGADMRLPCPVCAMTIKRKRNLQAHIKVKHPQYYKERLESKQSLF